MGLCREIEIINWRWIKKCLSSKVAHEYEMRPMSLSMSCAIVTQKINTFFEERNLLEYRTLDYNHSFGVLSNYYGHQTGSGLHEGIDTNLHSGVVMSMQPMSTIPYGQSGAASYRDHYILSLPETLTKTSQGFPLNLITT